MHPFKEIWTAQDAFIDLRNRFQFTDGCARCSRLVIVNASGVWARRFQQGERIDFFFEFEILRDLQFPTGGLELTSQAGLVVHGKNTFQHPLPSSPLVRRGSRLRYRFQIELRLAPGTYNVTLGLAGTDPDSYEGYMNGRLDHAELARHLHEFCRVVHAATLEITYAEGGKLLNYGVADLPGGAESHLTAPDGAPSEDEAIPDPLPARWPTVLHITHRKAGSQWIHKILSQCAPDRIVPPQLEEAQVRYYAIQRGCIYPTVYLSKTELDKIALPSGSRRFVVIRDLRDSLISAYFSFKISHPILESGMIALRETLCGLSQEDGLLYLLDHFIPDCAALQLSWLDSDDLVLKYEDLLRHDVELLEQALIGHCGMPIPRERLKQVVLANRFEALTGGRARGNESIASHERKGVAGDWRNHFTPRVKRAFNARFGGLLVAAGYEIDLNW
jgi:lipopolysaccharide transport system ATP-binding protein